MKQKWLTVLKTGNFKDSQGREHTFTESDLDHIASNYNAETHEAPIVVGHPKNNDPAFGWIEKVKRAGDKLLALPKQVNAEFAEMVKNGTFKKISVSLFPDKTLRHVGFLGAAAPAVKGLPNAEFADDETKTSLFDFEEAPEYTDFEEETKSVDELKVEIAKLSEKLNSIKDTEFSAELKTQLETLTTKITDLESSNKSLEADNRKIKADKAKADFNAYLEGKKKDGIFSPAQKAKALEIFEFASSADSFDFSSGEKKSPVQVVKEFIDLLGKQIEFSEFAKKEDEKNKRQLGPTQAMAEEIRKQMGNK